MRGNDEVLDVLNRALTIELTAINQYFCQSKMCTNWGFQKLAKKHWDESIGQRSDRISGDCVEEICVRDSHARAHVCVASSGRP